MMETLRNKFYKKYTLTQTTIVRNFIEKVDWTNRFIGIKGSRGVGKTTLLLQYIKKNFNPDNKVIYISLDDLYFTENSIYNFADIFYKKGGELLVIDEVHRYPGWSIELKNIYDDMPELRVIFTGSSLLHLQKAKSDLSRRVVMYELPGLSFREYLSFDTKLEFKNYSLDEIVNNHIEISMEIIQKGRPLQYFDDYLNFGYYPYFMENKNSFHQKLNETILTILEVDIPQFENIQTSNIVYLKKLLKIISRSVPFKPNMNDLSGRTGISLNTLKIYLAYLTNAKLISMLTVPEKGINSLNKPEKVFLENTNLIYNLAEGQQDIGNIRETFFYNQIKHLHIAYASKQADFLINNKYTFEIGGKTKQKKQIRNIEDSYIVKDNIEIGSDNIIPLWLFGFMY